MAENLDIRNATVSLLIKAVEKSIRKGARRRAEMGAI